MAREPQLIRDVLAQLAARKGYAQVQLDQQRQEAWQIAAGRLAADSRPTLVRHGVLQVLVRNSVVLQELTFQRAAILLRLKQLLPDERIGNVRFRCGLVD